MVPLCRTAMSEPKKRKDLVYALPLLSWLAALDPAVEEKLARDNIWGLALTRVGKQPSVDPKKSAGGSSGKGKKPAAAGVGTAKGKATASVKGKPQVKPAATEVAAPKLSGIFLLKKKYLRSVSC
jgi:hypothetical protein